MSLSGTRISRNYQQSIALAEKLTRASMRGRGHADHDEAAIEELSQSVLGDERVVELLKTRLFSEEGYRATLLIALDETRRLLFPDLAKRRFSSLDNLPDLAAEVDPESGVASAEIAPEDLRELLLGSLEAADAAYLQQHLLPHLPDWLEQLQQGVPGEHWMQLFRRNVQRIRHLFPDGRIPPLCELDGRDDLSAQQITEAYLACYAGLQPRLPQGLLSRDGDARAALLVRCLVERILQSTPEAVLADHDETFFLAHKLQCVYRHFNYSLNRALRNAWPDRIHPWIASRCNAAWWDDPLQRRQAIRWLVEEQLGLLPEKLYCSNISRADFAAHGLSYMFNRHYNAVSRALADAWPQLQPWQLGKVPAEVWNPQTAAAAICWMIGELGWSPHELPERVSNGMLSRRTFSDFGLATLFEKRFSRNIYRAIDAAWPGRFEPWEFGNVPASHWRHAANVFSASRWIAEREGIAERDIPQALRSSRLSWKELQKYSIANALKRYARGQLHRLFAPAIIREEQVQKESWKLLCKARLLARSGEPSGLLRGLFILDIFGIRHNEKAPYKRIAARIRKRARLL